MSQATPRPDAGTMRITVQSQRDERGRCQFTTEWLGHDPFGQEGIRAQVSYADPYERARDWRRHGWRVDVIEAWNEREDKT